MKLLILAALICLYSTSAISQNVGIAVNPPTERLDVNGNVNVRGTLKVNGDAGRPGQVLRVNNDGTQSWASVFGYKNRTELFSNAPFTVPPGVREIMIECIGGGGGGAKGGGGGGGGYVVGVYKVAPGAVLTINLGVGGSGSTTETGNGNDALPAFVTEGSSIFIVANGGRRATVNSPGAGGYSGSVTGDSLIFFRAYPGAYGEPTVESYSQRTATDYVTMRKYGDGGACAYNSNVIQKGTFFSFNTVTSFNVALVYGGDATFAAPGTGGAGGNTPTGNWGFNGGFGLVAISW